MTKLDNLSDEEICMAICVESSLKVAVTVSILGLFLVPFWYILTMVIVICLLTSLMPDRKLKTLFLFFESSLDIAHAQSFGGSISVVSYRIKMDRLREKSDFELENIDDFLKEVEDSVPDAHPPMKSIHSDPLSLAIEGAFQEKSVRAFQTS